MSKCTINLTDHQRWAIKRALRIHRKKNSSECACLLQVTWQKLLYLILQRYYYQMWLLLLSFSCGHSECTHARTHAHTYTHTVYSECRLTNASALQPLLSISCGNHVSTRRRIYGSEFIQRQLDQQWQLHFPRQQQTNESEHEWNTKFDLNL